MIKTYKDLIFAGFNETDPQRDGNAIFIHVWGRRPCWNGSLSASHAIYVEILTVFRDLRSTMWKPRPILYPHHTPIIFPSYSHSIPILSPQKRRFCSRLCWLSPQLISPLYQYLILVISAMILFINLTFAGCS